MSPDNLSKEDRIKTMRSVKSKKTGPERRLRAMLIGAGFIGWRINPEGIDGKPDFAFPDNKIAIFVDGCFWHGCPICKRTLPETNKAYWEKKINRNAQRDQEYTEKLQKAGWRVLRIWEHQLTKKTNLNPLAEKIKVFLKENSNAGVKDGNGAKF
jgi:DNA mismatch endonuclease (patch repair protein)